MGTDALRGRRRLVCKKLVVGQNVDSADSKKARVQWWVCRPNMTAAQAQLLIAAKRYVAKSDRARVAQHLQSFKWSNTYLISALNALGGTSLASLCR